MYLYSRVFKLSCIAVFFFCVNSVFAYDPLRENMLVTNPAVYFGYQGGYAANHWNNITVVFDQIAEYPGQDYGFADRFYIGYGYHFFAIEAGYEHFPDSVFHTTVTDVGSFDSTIGNYGLDFVVKLTVPFWHRFGVYAKTGVGYVNSTFYNIFVNSNGTTPQSQSHIGPVISTGFNVALSRNFTADASWMRFSGQGEAFNPNESFQPGPDIYLIGLTYKIPVTLS